MLDQETLDEIIRRIVDVARPEKIILFGFVARGMQEQKTQRLRSTEGSFGEPNRRDPVRFLRAGFRAGPSFAISRPQVASLPRKSLLAILPVI